METIKSILSSELPEPILLVNKIEIIEFDNIDSVCLDQHKLFTKINPIKGKDFVSYRPLKRGGVQLYEQAFHVGGTINFEQHVLIAKRNAPEGFEQLSDVCSIVCILHCNDQPLYYKKTVVGLFVSCHLSLNSIVISDQMKVTDENDTHWLLSCNSSTLISSLMPKNKTHETIFRIR